MVFVYKYWEQFCRALREKEITSIPACEVGDTMPFFLVLKHDIENNVSKAYKLAEIEHKYGHCGSYYAHACLLEDTKNVELLLKMQALGHEISYHHDVMDSNHGNIDEAMEEFEKNRQRFEALGFHLKTVCQHGNPIVERVGYTSNRDFFRNSRVQAVYPNIADIMVDYKEKFHTDYTYYSDAGRKFNLIFDPINNDIVKSDDKNTSYEDLNALLIALADKAIISTHPHRWTASEFSYIVSQKAFEITKVTAKQMMKVPVFKKIMSRYYYLAKRI